MDNLTDSEMLRYIMEASVGIFFMKIVEWTMACVGFVYKWLMSMFPTDLPRS